MGGGLESRCVGRVYGADSAVRLHGTIRATSPARIIFLDFITRTILDDVYR